MHIDYFNNEFEFQRFHRYLRYASMNPFMHLVDVFTDKIVEMLEDSKQDDAAEWFVKTLTGDEGNWMVCHAGAGFSNCNSSIEVSWRGLKGSMGEGAKRGAGFSLLRFHGNLVIWIRDNSLKSHARYVDQQWMDSFEGGGNYTKQMYEKFQDFPRLYVGTFELVDGDVEAWKQLKRMIVNRTEATLYDSVLKMRETGAGRGALLCTRFSFIVLSKFGEERFEPNFDAVRGVRTATMNAEIAKYVKYINPAVTTKESNKDNPKDFFKTCGSFHLVSIYSDSLRTKCTCPTYFHSRACEHTVMMSLLSDTEFDIPSRYVGSVKGVAGRPVEGKVAKVKNWNVWCCGDGMSDVDENETCSRTDGSEGRKDSGEFEDSERGGQNEGIKFGGGSVDEIVRYDQDVVRTGTSEMSGGGRLAGGVVVGDGQVDELSIMNADIGTVVDIFLVQVITPGWSVVGGSEVESSCDDARSSSVSTV